MHGVTPHHDLIFIVGQPLTELFFFEGSVVLDLFEVVAFKCTFFSARLFNTIVNEGMRADSDEVEY